MFLPGPLVSLRFSRRCGSYRGRRPGTSSRRKIWASLATPHSCTASARRWWTRIRMRWGPLTLPALAYCTAIPRPQSWGVIKMLCHVYVSVGSSHQGREPESFEQADGPGSERDQRQSRPGLSSGHSHREDFQVTHLKRRDTCLSLD